MAGQQNLFGPDDSLGPNTSETVTYVMFIDGASRGNPGHAGAGATVTRNGKSFLHEGFYLGKHTNNSAEYLALVVAAFFIHKEEHEKNNTVKIEVNSDSQLLVRQMQGRYRVKKLHIQELKTLALEFLNNAQCLFKHVVREKNTIADELANRGVDTKNAMPKTLSDALKARDIKIG